MNYYCKFQMCVLVLHASVLRNSCSVWAYFMCQINGWPAKNPFSFLYRRFNRTRTYFPNHESFTLGLGLVSLFCLLFSRYMSLALSLLFNLVFVLRLLFTSILLHFTFVVSRCRYGSSTICIPQSLTHT